jgi:hypothetical protein
VTGNAGRAEDYINRMVDGASYFIKPPEVPRVIETRSCIHCGKPYTLNIPYENCVPGARDLCDSCLIKGF